ncbi:MAG: DUF2726 domain-containing protein [Patescibacteria group bacterium]|jgi:very-short-patch-repair endonuclease
MTIIYIIAGIIIIAAIVLAIFRGNFDFAGNDAAEEEKIKYQYKKKNFFLTRSEHYFYDALVDAVGKDYRIFAQVHLSALVNHKISGQDWRAALAHINRKSVDFLLCDKAYLSPKLAIELDDRSHERPDRQNRDWEVERIFQAVGLPLLRLKNQAEFNSDNLAEQIKAKIIS